MNNLPFDIFEPDRTPREQSAREKEHSEKVSYRKYNNSGGTPCWECVKNSNGVRTATILRKQGQHESYLCGRHAQEQRDSETLRELAAKDARSDPPPPPGGRPRPDYGRNRRRYKA